MWGFLRQSGFSFCAGTGADIGDIPVPQIVDDTVEEQVNEQILEQIEPERIEEQIGDIPAPQLVDDTVEAVIGNVHVIAAGGPVGVSTAPVHGQARRELFVAEENDPELSGNPNCSRVDDRWDPQKARDDDRRSVSTERSHRSCCADVEHAALMAQRTNMSPD